MSVGELIALLSKYPPSALIVFEDYTEADNGEYDHFDCASASGGEEVILKLV